MNFSFPEEDNLKISNKYYLVIKQISEDFIKYISNFKLYSYEYIGKLAVNNKKFNKEYLTKIYKEKGYNKLNLNHIILMSSIIPSIIEQQIINLNYFIKSIDKKMLDFKNTFDDISTKYLSQFNNFKEIKNVLRTKYIDIEKLKINYFTNISIIEEMIHKFYIKKNFSRKRLNNSTIPDNFKDQNNNIPLPALEEQLNVNIKKVKRIEDNYSSNLTFVKTLEDKYIKISKESKDDTRKILCELLNRFKNFLLDCMLFLKNSYELPLNEINTYMDELVKLDENKTFDKIIISSYPSVKNFQSYIPQKYTLKFFEKNKKNKINENDNNIKLEKSNSFSLIKEDGFQEKDFFLEQEVFLTIKKMLENFKLLDSNDFDLPLEEEKLRCKFLILKLLSFSPMNKFYSDKITPITDKEADEIEKMMDKKMNRIIFIQKLSQFRNYGKFEIPKREYIILAKLFNKIIKNIDKNVDYDCIINVIILSQTYYAIIEEKKEYLQKEIMDNVVFKTKDFWENFINFSIIKEISHCPINDNLKDEDIESRYSNVVFSQLVPITKNMIDFGLEVDNIKSLILNVIGKYNINKEQTDTIFSLINGDKNKEEKDNNNKNEIIYENNINNENE